MDEEQNTKTIVTIHLIPVHPSLIKTPKGPPTELKQTLNIIYCKTQVRDFPIKAQERGSRFLFH